MPFINLTSVYGSYSVNPLECECCYLSVLLREKGRESSCIRPR